MNVNKHLITKLTRAEKVVREKSEKQQGKMATVAVYNERQARMRVRMPIEPTHHSLISNMDISEVTYSDHHLIACNISTDKPPPPTRIIHRRSLRRINWVEFE